MIFGIWGAIAVGAGAWLLSRLFKPQEREEVVTRDHRAFQLPLAEEGVPMPIVYGRVRLRAPQVLWWEASMEEHESVVTPKDGVRQVELRGSLALGLGLHVGNNDINRIFVGDDLIWQGFAAVETPQADESRLLRDFRSPVHPFAATTEVGTWNQLTSGWIRFLGFYGQIRWYPGTTTQGVNSVIDAEISDPVPNFRGFPYLMFEDCHLGEGPRPDAIHVECVGYPDALSLTGDNHKISNHANPAEVIYDLMTNEWGRLGMDTALINTASFTTTGNTLADEGNGISVLVDRGVSCIQVIREILDHIDGVLYYDPFDGQLHLGLVREDYTFGNLPIYNDDDMDASQAEREQTTWEDAIDQVRVSYEARASYNRKTQAIAQNMATYWGRSQARIRSKNIEYRYIKSWGPIAKIASRELLTASTPIQRVSIPFSRVVNELRPNSLFRWTSALYGFTDSVIRVLDIDYGSETEPAIVVRGFEDRFALDKQTYADPVEVTPTTLIVPAETTVKQTIEAPQWMMYRAEVMGLVPNRDFVRLFYAGRPAGTVETSFRPQVSEDAGSTYDEDAAPAGVMKFVETATVETAYDRTNEPYDTGTGLRVDNVSDATGSLQARSVAQIRNGSNLVLAVTSGGDQEILAYESFTDLTGGVYRLNNVWRGLLDTSPIDLAVGTRLWFLDDANIWLDNLGTTGFDGDEALKIKLNTFAGLIGSDWTGYAAEDLQLVQRSLLPYPVDDLEFGNRPESDNELADTETNEYPGDSVGGETNRWVVTSELDATWRRRDRNNESIRRGDDASESVTEGETHDVDGDSGSGFATLNGGSSVNAASAIVTLEKVGFGAGTLRCRTKRTVAGSPLNNFVDNEVLAQFAHYRQLLVNPHFDDATPGRGWTESSGDVAFASTSSSLNFDGTHAEATGTAVPDVLEQTVDVAALSPSGKDAVLEFYARDLNAAGAASVTVTLESLDSSDVVQDTQTSGALTPSTAHWDWHEVRITGLDPDTAKLKVTIELKLEPGPGTKGAVDGLRLRMAPGISSQLITNPHFNVDLSGWTPTNMTRQTSVNSEGAGYAFGNGAFASCSLVQDSIALGTHAAGDMLELRFRRLDTGLDTGQVTLEEHDNSHVVLGSVQTAAENLADGDWHERRLFLKLTSGSSHAQVQFDGVRVGGGNIDAGIDDVRLYLHDLT